MAGKPGVYITTDEFLDNANSASKDVGMPGVRKVALPSATYYRARGSMREVKPIAQAYIDKIIEALTRPATAEEANPKPMDRVAQDKPIKVTGKDYREAEARVNQLFLENRWADGLPIVAPTAAALKEMLGGTRRSPDEVLGVVAPKKGQATIRKVAVNAVMAGAKPEYLPVIIAAMEGFLDKNYDLTHVQASTGSFLPAIIVSGPIAKELNFNSGTGMLGHGWQANATVGRALRLCLLNLGLTWPGVNDMGLTGRASPYTFYTFGEDEERNPWEPEHVNYGMKPGDSSVSVSTVAGQYRVLGGGAVAIWTAQGVLDDIVSSMTSLGTLRPNEKHIVVFHPDCATELERMGFKSIRSVQEWLYGHARIPLAKLRPGVAQSVQRMIEDERIRPDRAPVFREALKEGGSLPTVQGPEDIHIFVAGGSPGYTLLFSYIGGSHQTRKITGATLTKAGR